MRILNIIPCLSAGGAERHLSYLAPALVQKGHSVHIAYSKEGSAKPELSGVSLHNLKSRSNYDPYLLWQIVILIRKIKPDTVHTWLLQMNILGGIAALLNRTKWVVSEQSSGSGYHQTMKHFLHNAVCSKANIIVSNSRGGDLYWKSKTPSVARYIVPNGSPLKDIQAIEPNLPQGLIGITKPIILYVGRLVSDSTSEKNVKRLLETLFHIKTRINFHCVLCGEGPQELELRSLRHSLGLDDVVFFAGFLPEESVWALMKKASVFVSISAFEGCPNAVIESMACGCTLVVSDIPAHRDILDEKSAIFVDPSNIQQVANGILKVLSDSDTSRKLSINAKEKSKQWSISRMVDKWEEVYLNHI